MVDHPSHVKKLTLDQLQQLAEEVRHELITKLAKNGGHLGPNLGVVELTIALHTSFPRRTTNLSGMSATKATCINC
jgi:1-deoxy-D-xylulose-5-phosphate synthase